MDRVVVKMVQALVARWVLWRVFFCDVFAESTQRYSLGEIRAQDPLVHWVQVKRMSQDHDGR